ncbi:hypothetical protein ACIHEJ_40220 [Streptomyces sp. NPDC052301]|uniref:hypothetical protein n=1 Tax=Streptomyces sp. NPDC052301 TaxID=3365687 RepID=UPI0037D3D725
MQNPGMTFGAGALAALHLASTACIARAERHYASAALATSARRRMLLAWRATPQSLRALLHPQVLTITRAGVGRLGAAMIAMGGFFLFGTACLVLGALGVLGP